MLVTSLHAAGATNTNPVRYWGDFSSVYRTRDYAGSQSQIDSWLNTVSINAASYLWRPWFATVRGGLMLSVDDTDYSDQPSRNDQYISGNAGLNLFPRSRFPTQVQYSQTKNELDDDLRKRDIETSEFILRQQYQTEDNAHRLRGEFINNTREDPTATDIEGRRLLLSSNHQLERNSLGAGLQLNDIEDSFTQQKSNSYSVTGRHSYRSEKNFTVENLASNSSLENELFNSQTDIKSSEFSSLMSWRPGTARDLSITGSLRLSDQVRLDGDDITTPFDESGRHENATANLNQGLLYQYSDHLRLQQSINANQIESNGTVSTINSVGVGFNYTPDRIAVGIGDYGWNFGSSYVKETGDIPDNYISNNRFSHSLDNSRMLGEGRNLRTRLTQTFIYSKRHVGFDRKGIDHSFLVTWTQQSNVDQAVLSLQLLDTRSDEDVYKSLQLVNLQFSGLLRFDRFTQLSGNATLQYSRRQDGDDKSNDTVTNGHLEYLRSRLFDVPRLLFRSRLGLSRQESQTEELVGDVIERDNNNESWRNSLEYLVGRLETDVSVDFVRTDGEFDKIFKVRVTRTFGDL